MPHPRDDLPKLFRSLGSDDAEFQASANASAREVEQRWPLFKAISPEKAAPTPALTEEERQRWTGPERSNRDRGTPALTLPGLSGKLASGLSKMSARTASDTTPPKAAMRAEPNRTQTEGRGIFASRPTQAASVVHESPTGLGLFETPTAKAALHHESADVSEDNSLKGIFSRLEGVEKDKVIASPVPKRSSFLGRLGRR